jgi:hypothetical protein
LSYIKLVAILAFGTAVAVLSPEGARANQLAGPVVTGTVTAIQGTDSITIGGQTYTVAPGSPAAQELGSLSPGEQVDAVLNGPASSSASQVVSVVVHKGA